MGRCMSRFTFVHWVYWYIWFNEVLAIPGLIKFTNLNCTSDDKSFADFTYCKLLVVDRGIISLNIRVGLYQLPVTNVTLNLGLWKKANGYRPFLYNYTIDYCAFMKNPKRNPFMKIFFDLLAKDSNMNHTCPYNHDIIVKDLLVPDNAFRLLPLPTGEYLFSLRVAAYNDWKANVKAYVYVSL